MAITTEITKEHIIKALDVIDKNGVPKNNESDRYDLVIQNNGEEKKYPPKYVVAVARQIATNGDISTDDFTSTEARRYLEKLKFSIANRETFELTISSSDTRSTDDRFTMDDLSLGDHYEPVNAYFKRADGTTISRNRVKGEKGISNQTLPRIACQVFQSELEKLTDEEKNMFPVCKYNPRSNLIHGIYPTVELFKRDFHNSIEYVCYPDRNGPQFVIYCWNVFSTLIFVQECLKRFGSDGDQFVLVYKEKDRDELTNVETEIPVGADTGAADVIDHDNALAEVSVDAKGPRNLIWFGAPGTGKSHQLKIAVEGKTDKDGKVFKDIEQNIGVFVDVDNNKIVKSRYERVTFYPTYSYAQFVGCYKPVMKPADGGKEEIAYEFVPGPFLRVLVDALKEPTHNHCLVIEEINRANAAAVFGDVFQLLDRATEDSKDKRVKKGESEYDVAASEDVKRFLQEEFKDCAPSKDDESEESKKRNPLNFLKVAFKKDAKRNDTKEWDSCRLRIPSNMYIWATMNSADQGVFPMDTAFKRRWEFEYIDIDNGSADCEQWSIGGKYRYNWNKVRRLLNGLLSLHRVNEDKLLGAHFVKPEKGTDTVSEKSFKSKVLMYLWEDAARMCRRQMFDDIGTYSALLKAWDENGVRIFSKDPELEKLKDAADTKKIFAELSKIAPRAESTQPKLDEQTQPDHEPTSDPAP